MSGTSTTKQVKATTSPSSPTGAAVPATTNYVGAEARSSLPAATTEGFLSGLIVDLYRRLWTTTEGTQAHDEPATNKPLRTALRAYAEGAFPAAVSNAGDVVDAIGDLYGRTHINFSQLAGQALASAGLNGVLSVGGSGADGAVMSAAYSNRVAGLVRQVLTVLIDNTKQTILTDIMGRLHVRGASHDDTSNSLADFEVAPLNLQVVEENSFALTNQVATAGLSFPSDDGNVMMGWTGLSLTGSLTCAAGIEAWLYVQGTNDRNVTPGSRVWREICGIRDDISLFHDSNVIYCPPAATVNFAWRFPDLNYVYHRARLVVTGAGNNSLSAYGRRLY